MPGYMKKAPAKKPAKAGKASPARKAGATKPGVMGKKK
jgi:hypothetical protein